MLRIYAIYDQKLGEYGPQLQCEKNASMMLRNLSDVLVKAPQLPLVTHAEDFNVMCVGEFDECTGEIKPYATCQLVENVKNLLPVVDKALRIAKEG